MTKKCHVLHSVQENKIPASCPLSLHNDMKVTDSGSEASHIGEGYGQHEMSAPHTVELQWLEHAGTMKICSRQG